MINPCKTGERAHRLMNNNTKLYARAQLCAHSTVSLLLIAVSAGVCASGLSNYVTL